MGYFEYRVYYKDHANKTWDEWFEFGGFTLDDAEKVKARIEKIEGLYDVEIRLITEIDEYSTI